MSGPKLKYEEKMKSTTIRLTEKQRVALFSNGRLDKLRTQLEKEYKTLANKQR
jgi:hypothetical protein